MADIFGGATDALPPWLRTTPQESQGLAQRLGDTLGTGLAAGVRWATQSDNENPVNENTGEKPKISFGQAWQEARMSQENPVWRLQTAMQQTKILDAANQLQDSTLSLEMKKEEAMNWRHDSPKLSKWLASGAKGDAPEVTSQKATGIVQQVDQRNRQAELKEKMNDLKEQGLDLTLKQGQAKLDEAKREFDAKQVEAARKQKEAEDARTAIEETKQKGLASRQDKRIAAASDLFHQKMQHAESFESFSSKNASQATQALTFAGAFADKTVNGKPVPITNEEKGKIVSDFLKGEWDGIQKLYPGAPTPQAADKPSEAKSTSTGPKLRYDLKSGKVVPIATTDNAND